MVLSLRRKRPESEEAHRVGYRSPSLHVRSPRPRAVYPDAQRRDRPRDGMGNNSRVRWGAGLRKCGGIRLKRVLKFNSRRAGHREVFRGQMSPYSFKRKRRPMMSRRSGNRMRCRSLSTPSADSGVRIQAGRRQSRSTNERTPSGRTFRGMLSTKHASFT